MKQEAEYDAKAAIQLINELRSSLRELQIAKHQGSNEKKLIIAPIPEEPQKNLNADANKGKSNKLPIDEIHVKGAPSGGGSSGGSGDEEESKSPTKSYSSK